MRSVSWVICIGVLGLSSVVRTQDPAPPAGAAAREIPVPPIATGMASLPGVAELPSRPAMPDVMVMNDGTTVTTRRQWQQRREEMRQVLSYYAVGHMPPPPGNVKGREIATELVLDGTVRYRLIRLTFGPKQQLGLDIGVFTPVTGGPFPAVILQGGTPPGATVQPRLPPGPNQGRGENVLLMVGPVPVECADVRWRSRWPHAADSGLTRDRARGRVAPRLRAGAVQPERLCRRHHAS